MADQIDDVIGEVARTHGIAIGRDDPILVLHTMNRRLIEDNTVAQQALLDAHKAELEALASRWGTDATDRADRIMHAVVISSKDAMAAMLQQEADAAAAHVRTEVDAALARVAIRLQDAHRIAMLNVLAACITLAAAGLVVWGRMP
ncbi:MAG TPA: conjugal transfer protein TraM [Noviherbaspirillum sp.]